MMAPDAVLASAPSTIGMTPVHPRDCQELLKLCTVMNWKPRIPLNIMRDESAGRWFMKGAPGEQDYWMRDADIAVLRATPMWASVLLAKPYGYIEPLAMPNPPYTADPLEMDKLRRAAEAVTFDVRSLIPSDKPMTATEIDLMKLEKFQRLKELIDSGKVAMDRSAVYKAIMEGVPIPAPPKPGPGPYRGMTADYIVMDDVEDMNDPVVQERHKLAQERLAAEERLKKMDEWDE